jgi:hypothetical protein
VLLTNNYFVGISFVLYDHHATTFSFLVFLKNQRDLSLCLLLSLVSVCAAFFLWQFLETTRHF